MDAVLPTVMTRARHPVVSVVVGNYNQARFIEAAIQSVAAQTYRQFDCVVVDDASTDGSRVSIEKCLSALADARFRFIRRESNGGQMAAVLTGIDATTGPFVAILDGDDMWDPEFLERHVEAHLSRAGAAALSCSDLAMIDESGALLAGGLPNFRMGDPRINPSRYSILGVEGKGEEMLVFVDRGGRGWPWSTTSGMMFRRNVVEAIRPSDASVIRISADAYLARAAHLLGGTVRLERSLGCYRVHGGNLWAKTRFFGAGSRLGVGRPEIELAIRIAVIERLLAPEFESAVSRRQLRKMLVSDVGWHEALQLCKTNSTVRKLLEPWANPPRRVFMQVMALLPQSIVPRRFRDRSRERQRRPAT